MNIKLLLPTALMFALLMNSLAIRAEDGFPPTVASEAAESLVRVEWSSGKSDKISDAEQAALTEYLHAALTSALAKERAEGRAVEVRAVIKDVNTVSPALNTASALLLFLPFDRGGVTVEFLATDRETGLPLASMTGSYSPPMRKMRARFKKLAPAHLALDKLAYDFSHLLVQATSSSH